MNIQRRTSQSVSRHLCKARTYNDGDWNHDEETLQLRWGVDPQEEERTDEDHLGRKLRRFELTCERGLQ